MAKRFCPNCGGKDIKPDMSGTTSFSHGNITDWICNNCGYTGVMPTGEPDEDFEFDEPEPVEEAEDQPSIKNYILFILLFVLTLTLLYLDQYYL